MIQKRSSDSADDTSTAFRYCGGIEDTDLDSENPYLDYITSSEGDISDLESLSFSTTEDENNSYPQDPFSMGMNYLNSFNLNLHLSLRNSTLWKIYENGFITRATFLQYREKLGGATTAWMPQLPEKGIFTFPNLRYRRDDQDELYNGQNHNETDDERNYFDEDEEVDTDCEDSYCTEEERPENNDESEECVSTTGTQCFRDDLWASVFGHKGQHEPGDSHITLATKHYKSPVNPFYHRIHLTMWDKIKMGILTVTLLPLRIMLILATLVVACTLAKIGTFGLTFEMTQAKPLSWWRRTLRTFISHVVMRALFFFAGFHWVKVKGKKASATEAPVLVVAPHSSMWDAFPLIMMGAPSVVAKSDTKNTPFFGRLVDYTQPVYVNREDTKSRQNSAKIISQRANLSYSGTEVWPQIYLYPEGTCTNRSALIKFKAGAFIPGVPVQPVLVKYPNRLDSISWTFDGLTALQSIWYTLAQFHNHMEIEYLPVYHPNEAEKKDANLYANNVCQVMAKALEIPTCDFTYEDGLLLNEMNDVDIREKLNKILQLRGALKLQESPIESHLMYKKLVKSDADWCVSYSKFCQLVDTKENSVALQVFKLFEVRQDGKSENCESRMDLRAYFSLVCCLYTDVPLDLVTSVMFKMYGEGKNVMTSENFTQLMKHVFGVKKDKAMKILSIPISGDESSHIGYDEFQTKVKRRIEYVKLYALEASKKHTPYEFPGRTNRDKGISSRKEKCD